MNDLTRDDLLGALDAISPACERSRWIATGLACHDAGLDCDDWGRWSARDANAYPGAKQIKSQWRSICRTAKAGNGGNPAPLIALAKSEGWELAKPSGDDKQPAPSPPQRKPLPTPARAKRATERPEMTDAQRDALLARILAVCSPAIRTHPYLVRKDIEPTGMHCLPVDSLARLINYTPESKGEKLRGDVLVVPLIAPESGAVQALEFIDSDGRKSGLAGVKRGGLVWTAALALPSEHHALIGIAEGVATACSAQAALRLLPQFADAVVLAASSSGNMPAVAERVHKLRPAADIVLFGDSGNGSQSATDAAEAVGGIDLIPAPHMVPEGGKDWNDACAHIGYAAVALHFASALRDPTIITFPRTEQELLPLHFVLPGLPVGGVGMIAGPGAVGKTFLVMQMAIGLVFGKSCLGEHLPQAWCGRSAPCDDAKPLRVAMILGEDDAPIIQRREWNIGAVHAISAAQRDLLDNRLHVHTMVGRDLRVVQAERYGQIGPGPFMPRLYRICSNHDLVVVDPLVRLHDSQENDNSAASALITALSRIGRETGCTILLLHHFGKTEGAGTKAARGASAYSTSVRWQANLVPLTQEEASIVGARLGDEVQYVKLDLTKSNYIAPQAPLVFRRGEHGVLRATADKLTSAQSLPGNATASGAARKAQGNGQINGTYTPNADDDPFGPF